MNITCEDCMDLMARYPDKHFGLAVVDPPYGIGAENGTGDYAREKCPQGKKWDKRPEENYFIELFRVSKNQIVFGGNYFKLPIQKGWVCWYKSDEVKGRDFSEIELIWTSFNEPGRHYTEKPFIRNGQRIHPTQKPVALYKWLLARYAKTGWKILDTHLGSGSIAIACHDLGFDLTACEIDKDYYSAAMERIREYQRQEQFEFEEGDHETAMKGDGIK
jgi:site-specific DNA-methyltransferase (adenine-specific)